MINPLLSRANTKELAGVASTVVDVVEKSAYKDKKLTDLNVMLKKEGDDLTTAQNRKRKNDLTEVVDALEKGRDNGFKAFSFTTKGMTLRMDETLSSNARLIYEVIKRHGLGLYKLPNLEQTAQMKSLTEELNKPVYKTAMDTTGLTVVYDEMNLMNSKYLQGSSDKNESVVKKVEEETEKVVKARKKTKNALDAIIGYVNSSVLVDYNVDLKQLCENVALVIDKANTNIHARINRGKNGSNNDEADELDDEMENEV